MYLVYKEILYGNEFNCLVQIVNLAIFVNEKDAEDYVNHHKNSTLYIKKCVNGKKL